MHAYNNNTREDLDQTLYPLFFILQLTTLFPPGLRSYIVKKQSSKTLLDKKRE
jgi:hypothetical protein